MEHGTDLDLAAVRGFLAVADEGQLTLAAVVLGISQQAVSKRIAKLEAALGVTLFERVRTGAVPTVAGTRFLPHARSLLALAEEAVATVRAFPRPLRVAVLGERQAAMRSMRFYLDRHPGSNIEIVLSDAFVTSRDALLSGRADAAFARANGGPRPLPAYISAAPVLLEPLHLLVGRRHPLAGQAAVPLAELAGSSVWVPGAAVPSEWADFYRDLGEFADIEIDTARPEPGSGIGRMVERIAASDVLCTFNGDDFDTPYHPELRRVRVVDPAPAYPHALLWDATDPHPDLTELLAHCRAHYNADTAASCWLPEPDRPLFVG
ncbi:LysR family transcriptional regulator [Nocardia asteroides]|uniref:LysR family transcriptional regulator n=1 Tax=Nocardia asteroides TaxID=1824 RepID=UPI001E315550|nr:LysR family transcriptional regulator [Nocardia asteroides]UGT63564.1 LysR family transcriptional regulator [Nocardia asteroides]